MTDRIKEAVGLADKDGTLTVTLPLYVVAVLLFIIIVLGIILWSTKRRRDPHFRLQDDVDINKLLPSVAGLTQGDVEPGNQVQLLQNGDGFFPVLFEELKNARESISFETYLWEPGRVARETIDVLSAKAREGVAVRLLVDASGGKLRLRWRRRLKKAGVHVARYHPWRFGNVGIINNRDHRKIMVVDGRVGFVGGHCIKDQWLGNAQDKKHFRDLSVRVEGPIVHRLQSAFCENWLEETGEVLAGPKFFPDLTPRGEVPMHLVYTTPRNSVSAVELLHFLVVHGARETIRIQNPYFLPDPDLIEAINDAADRGVDVRIMIPAAEATDHPVVQHASHHHFGSFLKHGVKLYEYTPTLLHQKVITVDHTWSAIGSTNIDDRSFELNDEVSLGIYDANFAAQLEQVFDEDCRNARPLQLDEWKRRGFIHKLKDGTFYLINEQL